MFGESFPQPFPEGWRALLRSRSSLPIYRAAQCQDRHGIRLRPMDWARATTAWVLRPLLVRRLVLCRTGPLRPLRAGTRAEMKVSGRTITTTSTAAGIGARVVNAATRVRAKHAAGPGHGAHATIRQEVPATGTMLATDMDFRTDIRRVAADLVGRRWSAISGRSRANGRARGLSVSFVLLDLTGRITLIRTSTSRAAPPWWEER